MKVKLKNYWPHILAFVIVVFWAINTSVDTMKWDMRRQELDNELYSQHCMNLGENTTEDLAKTCAKVEKRRNQTYSFFPLLSEEIDFRFRVSPTVFILLIIVPSGMYISKYLKNRILLTENNRQSYKKSLRKAFKKSYAMAFVLPATLLLVFALFFWYTKSFDLSSFEDYTMTPWRLETMKYPLLFLGSWLLNTTMICLFYVNCNLFISRKFHNYFISIILTFLMIIGIELFFEIVVNSLICRLIFHSEIGIIFNIFSLHTFLDSFGVLPTLTFSTVLCILSFVAVGLAYRNKEKLVLDCEKNI